MPPCAMGPVPSLSGLAIAYRWRSLPRVRRHRASSPQGSSSNGCCLCSYHHGPINVRLSFPTPTKNGIYNNGHVECIVQVGNRVRVPRGIHLSRSSPYFVLYSLKTDLQKYLSPGITGNTTQIEVGDRVNRRNARVPLIPSGESA